MVPVVINRKAIEERDQRLQEYSEIPYTNNDPSKEDQLIIVASIGLFCIFCLMLIVLYLKMLEEKTLKSKIYYYGSIVLYLIVMAALFLYKKYS